MTNLRQEVTEGARSFDADTTPLCPHLSTDPYVKGKQIRAVAIDRIIDGALLLAGTPTFDLKESDSPRRYLVEEATDTLVQSCRRVLQDTESQWAEMYMDSFSLDEEDTDLLQSPTNEFETIRHLGGFIKSGVSFSASIIRLVQLALPDITEVVLYAELSQSYSGCAKKFTGGKSVSDLDLAKDGIRMRPKGLVDYVIRSDGKIALKPMIIKAAANALQEGERKLEAKLSGSDHSGVCPASIDIHDDGRPVVTERIWQWTIEVARRSELIETMRAE